MTAVDPHPRGMAVVHPRLRHEAVSAEEFLSRGEGSYDLVVNDMYQRPADSARLMVAAAGLLRAGGSAVMTLKLPVAGGLGAMDRALRILRTAYRIPRLRQLASGRHEVTAWLRPLVRE